jgi:hypothetical protein
MDHTPEPSRLDNRSPDRPDQMGRAQGRIVHWSMPATGARGDAIALAVGWLLGRTHRLL